MDRNATYLPSMERVDMERWRARMDKECHDLTIRLLIGAAIIIAIFATLVTIF